mgnify:CR=1 FL=1
MNFKQWLLTESMTLSDAIEALGLEHDFTPEQLKTAFRNKSKQHHTDRGGNLRASIDVNAAYDVLRKYLDDKKLQGDIFPPSGAIFVPSSEEYLSPEDWDKGFKIANDKFKKFLDAEDLRRKKEREEFKDRYSNEGKYV